MRRHFLALQTAACAAVCLLFFSSCRAPGGTGLSYRERFSSATLTDGSTEWCLTRAADGYTVTCGGVTFSVREGGTWAHSGSVSIPLSPAAAAHISSLVELFTVPEDSLVAVDRDGSAHYRTERAEFTVTFHPDGSPASMTRTDADGTVRYTVTAFLAG